MKKCCKIIFRYSLKWSLCRFICNIPTEHFTILVPHNPPINVSALHKNSSIFWLKKSNREMLTKLTVCTVAIKCCFWTCGWVFNWLSFNKLLVPLSIPFPGHSELFWIGILYRSCIWQIRFFFHQIICLTSPLLLFQFFFSASQHICDISTELVLAAVFIFPFKNKVNKII